VALMEVISALKDSPRSTPSTWMSAAAEDVVNNKASTRTVAGQYARLNSTAPSMFIFNRSFQKNHEEFNVWNTLQQGVELWMYAESLERALKGCTWGKRRNGSLARKFADMKIKHRRKKNDSGTSRQLASELTARRTVSGYRRCRPCASCSHLLLVFTKSVLTITLLERTLLATSPTSDVFKRLLGSLGKETGAAPAGRRALSWLF
jgi:hypothetical protein